MITNKTKLQVIFFDSDINYKPTFSLHNKYILCILNYVCISTKNAFAISYQNPEDFVQCCHSKLAHEITENHI